MQSETRSQTEPPLPSAREHLGTLAARVARSVALDGSTLALLRNGSDAPPSPLRDTLHAVATTARRLDARSLDATLTSDALYVALDTPETHHVPTGLLRVHQLVEAVFGVPLQFQRGTLITLPTVAGGQPTLVATAHTAGSYLCRIESLLPDSLLGEDAEATHQLRVAVRRLRTALRAMAREAPPGTSVESIVALARRVGALAARVRDHDVVIEMVADVRAPSAARDAARERLEERRTGALARFEKFVTAGSYPQRLAHARDTLTRLAAQTNSRPIEQAADAQLARELRRTSEQLRADLTTAGAYHDIRRAVRRVRDTIEVFGPALQRRAVKWRKRLQPAQVMLGRLNDVDTALTLLPRTSRRMAPVRSALEQIRRDTMAELAVPLSVLAVLLLSRGV